MPVTRVELPSYRGDALRSTMVASDHTTTQAWLADLARAVTAGPAAREREAVGDARRI